MRLAIILLIIIAGANLEGKTQSTNKGTKTIKEQNKGTITAINWYTLDEAKKVQENKGLPLMIDFYADWCIWCKILDNVTFKDKDVIEESLKFIPARVDCTKDRTIANEYKILGLPTIVFEGTQGMRYDVIGFRNPKDFIKEMKKAGKKIKP